MISNKAIHIEDGVSGFGRGIALQAAETGATVVKNNLDTSPEEGGSNEKPAQAIVDGIESDSGKLVPIFAYVTHLKDLKSPFEEIDLIYERPRTKTEQDGLLGWVV